MNINHALLYEIGVSKKHLKRLMTTTRKTGSLGLKLAGTNGGGCMIVLSKMKNFNIFSKSFRGRDGTPFIARKTCKGVKIE